MQDDVVVFEVTLNGEGLLGEAEFVLAPKETATYELVFSPLLPSKTKGTAVFLNDGVGEFWYDLDLIAEPAPPEDHDRHPHPKLNAPAGGRGWIGSGSNRRTLG